LIHRLYKFVDFLDAQVNKRIYDKIDVFKDECRLNELRFAITLWTKEFDNSGYNWRFQTQYISNISTQNKSVRLH
jgi:hypothetical protein